MPELPEVLSISKYLNENLKGEFLSRITVFPGCKKYENFPKIKDLPWLCKSVKYRSKRIYFTFLTDKNEKIYLFSFLGMTGKWLISDASLPEKCNHLWMELSFENGKNAYFCDARRFGNNLLLTRDELLTQFSKLGPDWYLDEITFDYFMEKASKSKKEVSDFLLDTKITTGIGNYLKSEIIYAASKELFCKNEPIILPYTEIKKLSIEQLKELYCACRKVIMSAVMKKGYSLRDYVMPDGEKGTFVPKVYNQKITEDGEKVLKETFKDGRSTFYVVDFFCLL